MIHNLKNDILSKLGRYNTLPKDWQYTIANEPVISGGANKVFQNQMSFELNGNIRISEVIEFMAYLGCRDYHNRAECEWPAPKLYLILFMAKPVTY